MRILFLGAAIAPHDDKTLTAEQKFGYVGRNTGNLLIGQSIFDELVFSDFSYGVNFPPEEVNTKFDLIVIAAANFIFKNFDFGNMADFLEPTKLPILMVGLGAQAPDDGSKIEDIPAGTRRLLSIVADRSKVIGVRGHYTAEVMNTFGHKNIRPVGCPSLYRALKRDLRIKRVDSFASARISFNGSRNVVQHSHSPTAALKLEAKLLALALTNSHNYVLQSELPELFIAAGEDMTPERTREITSILRHLGLHIAPEEYVQKVRENFKIFFDLGAWDEYIRNFDISIGSRFHGNLIALTNGVPAVLFTHDSRTTEMAELMHIPHMPVDTAADADLEDVVGMADFAAFERRYRVLYDGFAEFLTENGVQHKLADAERLLDTGGEIRARERLSANANPGVEELKAP